LNSFLFTPARRSSAAQLLVRAHATAVELIGDNAWAGLEFCQCAGAIEAWNLRGSPGLLISGLAGVAGGAEGQGVTEQGQGARSPYRPRNKRNILCVFPAYAPSFGTFQHAYKLFPDVSGFMPPQGLLLIAACLPAGWNVRFIDENHAPARNADFEWADAVLMSGMHVQRRCLGDINEHAH